MQLIPTKKYKELKSKDRFAGAIEYGEYTECYDHNEYLAYLDAIAKKTRIKVI